MSADIAFISVLSSDDDTTTLVGTRIYPIQRPQKSGFPAIMVRVNSTDPYDTKDGVSGLDEEYVGVFIYAKTRIELNTLSGYVRTALDRFVGTEKTIVIQSVQFQNKSNYVDEIQGGLIYVQEDEYKARITR